MEMSIEDSKNASIIVRCIRNFFIGLYSRPWAKKSGPGIGRRSIEAERKAWNDGQRYSAQALSAWQGRYFK